MTKIVHINGSTIYVLSSAQINRHISTLITFCAIEMITHDLDKTCLLFFAKWINGEHEQDTVQG